MFFLKPCPFDENEKQKTILHRLQVSARPEGQPVKKETLCDKHMLLFFVIIFSAVTSV